jgi:hypothetical protein
VPDWGTLQVDQLRHMAREHGDQIAYRNLGAGTTLTFTEWDEQSNQLARFLVSRVLVGTATAPALWTAA